MTRKIQSTTILAIETATSSCSVALGRQGDVFSRSEVGSNVHSQVLLEMVEDVLKQGNCSINALDAVAVGQGPGSFTGLRIGVGVAQGIAYGVSCPMIGVSSLDALANQAANGRVIAAIDARMGEAYWCEYLKSNDVLERQSVLQVGPPLTITSKSSESLVLVGNAWQEYQGQFDADLLHRSAIQENQIYPSANSLLDLAFRAFARGDTIEAIDFAPEYVRNDVAKKSSKLK